MYKVFFYDEGGHAAIVEKPKEGKAGEWHAVSKARLEQLLADRAGTLRCPFGPPEPRWETV